MNLETNHPFANANFLNILETSHSVSPTCGWIPNHFSEQETLLPSYIKLNSLGEYIFDWGWAQFYQQNQLNYFPKLLHAIPFTPVNAPKCVGNESLFEKLAIKSFTFYQEQNLSSEHYLFINESEQKVLEQIGFTTKFSLQYHFENCYQTFDDFLNKLKKNKRKTILKERKLISQSDLTIKTYTKKDITNNILLKLYECYLSTINKKGSYPYFNKEFFLSLSKMNIIIICAEKEENIIAMALFFKSNDTLYGRNWGIIPEYVSKYPFLHFELCYYRGIEFCINNKLKLFEAGAQGEHKLFRGFRPVTIKSSHHIKIPQCYKIIQEDIKIQNKNHIDELKILESYLPFKK